MSEIIIPIPARLKNVAKGGHVAGAEDIIDDALNKEQSVINQETLSRLDTVQQKVDDIGDSIQFDEDGDLVTENGDDFSDDTARGKIPTIGAIKDGADDEPTAGSSNLVKSGGVYPLVEDVSELKTDTAHFKMPFEEQNFQFGSENISIMSSTFNTEVGIRVNDINAKYSGYISKITIKL